MGIVVVGGYFLLPDFAQNLGYVLIGGLAVVAILLGVLRHRPDKSLPWYTVACGILMFVIGDAIWAYYEGIQGVESPFPSAADGFYLAGYPLLAGGLALMIGFRISRRDRRGLIDVAIITVGTGLLLWVFFMEPYMDDGTLPLSERLISISYPLGDLLLTALTARLIFAPGPHRPAYYLLISSLVLLLISDVFYAELVLTDSYETGGPIGAGWLFSYLLFGAAALHPSMRSLSEVPLGYMATLTWIRWVLLGAALSAAPVALAIQAFLRGHIDVPLILGGWAALILLTLLRMATIFRGRERAISRERILRDASSALVKAPDRERVYAAALEAVLPFMKEAPGTRVSVWSGSAEKDRCVGAAGHRAEDIRGKETYIKDFPDWLRTTLMEGETAELKAGQPSELREAFGFATKVGAIFMVPLMVHDRFEGRIAVASDSELPGDIRYVLEALGSQVTLALERVSLSEELYRRRSDERFRKLIQNSSDIVTLYEADGTVRYVSPAIKRVLGYEPEERIDASGFEIVHPDDLPQVKRAFSEALPSPGATISLEVRARHRDGSWRHIEAVGTNLLHDPDLRAVVLNSRDITERKRAEEELRRSEARNRAIVEAYPDLMFRVSSNGEYLDFQTNDDNYLYMPREHIIGNTIRDTLPPDVATEALRHVVRALETGNMQFYEYQLPMSEGRRDFEARFVATDEDEVLCIIRDVTSRKALEEALRESEERFRTIFEQTAVGISIADPQGKLLETNAAYQEITGYSEEELFNKPIAELSHPDDASADDELHRELLSGSVERYQREKRYIRKDGEVVWVSPTVSAVRDAEGRLRFLIGIVEDITERKRAEERLRESEQRFRQLFEQSVDTLIVHDEEGRILDCNSEACRTLGYTREELLSLRVHDIATGLLSEEERKKREEQGGTLWQRVVRGEPVPPAVVHYGEHKRKDGTTFPIEVHVGGVDYDGRRRILASVHDITKRKETERRLEESQQRYKSLFEHNPDAVYSFDLEGNFLTANAACEEVSGYTVEELLQMSFVSLIVPEDLERTLQYFEKVARGEPQTYEIAITHKAGHRVELNVTKLPIIVADEIVGVYGIAKDITDRKRAEKDLRESEERYRAVVERATDGIYIYDFRTKRVLESNTALQNMLGYTPEDLPGMTIYDLIANSRESIDRNTQRIEEEKSAFLGERLYRRKDDSLIDVESSVTLIPYADTEAACCIVRDITERKELEARLAHQAFHDSLTGLPNRLLFLEHLERALGRARRQGNRVGVLFMDLDNFKYVNDSLGHEAGDQLLISVAERLREAVRPGDTVARLGGDELTVLLEEVADAREATQIAERIERVLRAPLTLEGREVFVGASIGITLSSSTQDQPEKLLRHADLAMYRAKNKGKARHEIFTPGMETAASNRLQLANDLRRAVERGEMRVYYQPKMRLSTSLQQQEPKVVQEGQIVGMEALVRWEHPQLGTVSPKDFISTAEETGLILPIGRRVLEEACRQVRAWQEQYPADPPLVICVNLSARQFQRQELAQDIARMLQKIGLDPRCLELEITESVVMEEAESTLNILSELRDLGVGLAIDDFGTGYSSLSYLKRFPVDSLKIDRFFVEGIGGDSENAVIVSGIITLAHTLGIQVIAEGVETADQAAHLRRIGCDLAQGDYFSKPLPGEAAGELLARNKSTHS